VVCVSFTHSGSEAAPRRIGLRKRSRRRDGAAALSKSSHETGAPSEKFTASARTQGRGHPIAGNAASSRPQRARPGKLKALKLSASADDVAHRPPVANVDPRLRLVVTA
jgi:hypothetical protein